MNDLKLCFECELRSGCETICEEASDFEKEDYSDCYEKGEYKAKGVPLLSYDQSRRFKDTGHPWKTWNGER